MTLYYGYKGSEPAGTIIVRIVASEAGPRAHIREVIDPDDPAREVIEVSEEMDVPEALALARNKRTNMETDGNIVIELGPGAAWDEQWGQLSERLE